MRLLLITFGSSGDVNPFVGLGVALKARGHAVTLATNPYFEDLARRAGLAFLPMGTRADFEATLSDPDLWHPRRGLKYVMRRGVVPLLRPSYDVVRAFAQGGNAGVVASMLALGARLAQEKDGVPVVSVHLQPQVFQSLEDTPVYPQQDISRWPRWAKRLVFWMGDRMLSQMLSPEYPALRRDLGLPPVTKIMTDWVHSPLLTLGLWPDWFARPQPDWPASARLTGFPLYDAAGVEQIPPELDAFLTQGPPPVVFTPGSAMRQGKRFFAESVEACRRLGCRGLLLTKFPDQLPQPLPNGVSAFGYIPFSQILPRAAALVHHGGIGTTSQALAAGIPQLVMPLSHDQPDNAARVARLGVSLTLPLARYTAASAAAALQRLQQEPSFKTQALRYRDLLKGSPAMGLTCDRILGVLQAAADHADGNGRQK